LIIPTFIVPMVGGYLLLSIDRRKAFRHGSDYFVMWILTMEIHIVETR
jgi:hypothetical protein